MRKKNKTRERKKEDEGKRNQKESERPKEKNVQWDRKIRRDESGKATIAPEGYIW